MPDGSSPARTQAPLLALCFFGLLFSSPTTSAPGPWVSPPDLSFGRGSDDVTLAQTLLPEARSLRTVADEGGTAATDAAPAFVGSRGTGASRFVQELVLAIAPYVNTEEIMIDDNHQHLHGIAVNTDRGGILDGTDDVTLHSAAELEHDQVMGYSKLVLLLADGEHRLLACVAHLVGTQVTLSSAVATLATGVPRHAGGGLLGASLTTLSSQHFAVSFSTSAGVGRGSRADDSNKNSSKILFACVHPTSDAIQVQSVREIAPVVATDSCVIASMTSVIVVSVTDTSPPFATAWLAALRVQTLSDRDDSVWASVSVDTASPPDSVSLQVGNIYPGTVACSALIHSGPLAAVVTYRSMTPFNDCGAYPAPAHATVSPSGRVLLREAVNITCNAGFEPSPGSGSVRAVCRGFSPDTAAAAGRAPPALVSRGWVFAAGVFDAGILCRPISCGHVSLPPHTRGELVRRRGFLSERTVYPASPDPANTSALVFGDGLLLSCGAGFVLSESGSASVVCLADGSLLGTGDAA